METAINRITHDSFHIFNKKSKELSNTKSNQTIYFPNYSRYNEHHEHQNNKISKGLKSNQKNNNNYQRNMLKKFKSKEHFSNNIVVLNSNTGKTQNDSEEVENYNDFHLLNSMNNNENI